MGDQVCTSSRIRETAVSLPQASFARRADGVEKIGTECHWYDQGAVFGNVEAQEQRIGACEVLALKAVQQWIVEPAAIGFRAGAVDYAVDMQGLLFAALAVAVGDFHAVLVFPICRDPAAWA